MILVCLWGVRPCLFLVLSKILICIIDVCILMHVFISWGREVSREERIIIISMGVFNYSNSDPDRLTGSLRFADNQTNRPACRFASSCSQKEIGSRESASCHGTLARDVFFSYSRKKYNYIFGKKMRWVPRIKIHVILIQTHPWIERAQIV